MSSVIEWPRNTQFPFSQISHCSRGNWQKLVNKRKLNHIWDKCYERWNRKSQMIKGGGSTSFQQLTLLWGAGIKAWRCKKVSKVQPTWAEGKARGELETGQRPAQERSDTFSSDSGEKKTRMVHREIRRANVWQTNVLPGSADKFFWLKKLPLVIAFFPVQAPYLNYLRQLRGRKKLFLSLLGLNCLQLQRRFICHRGTFWGGIFCSPSIGSISLVK